MASKKTIYLIPKRKALGVLSRVEMTGLSVHYLCDDYKHYVQLQNKLSGIIEIHNLAGQFDEIFQEIKQPVLDEFLKVNKALSSFEWWGNQLASKSSSATPLFVNIVYLVYAKKVMKKASGNLTFIVDSDALACCLSDYASTNGLLKRTYGHQMTALIKPIKRWMYYAAQVFYFLWQSLQNHQAAIRTFPPHSKTKSAVLKRVLIRSWITNNTFDQNGEFNDRNFGDLYLRLRSQGYDVSVLPMFFNLSMCRAEMYALMRKANCSFVIPEHYLRFSDYMEVLANSYRSLTKTVRGVWLQDMDISGLFNEVLKRNGLNVGLSLLNTSSYLIKRLNEAGFELDEILYPFECNAPENQFVLSCRRYFAQAKIVGFQHTTLFPNQTAYHFAEGEHKIHPLPDKIVSSGPGYVRLLKKARIPENILIDGPNLRFSNVYRSKTPKRENWNIKGDKKMLLLPLTYSYELAFDLLKKVNDALKGQEHYSVFIRNHPLLSRSKLTEFLQSIKMNDYEFADDGIFQDWLPKTYAVLSAGGSVTSLEAMAMGVPVIRVIPDNTIHYDSLTISGYPFTPVNTASAIRRQLQDIDEKIHKGIFNLGEWAEIIIKEYFTRPTEESFKSFMVAGQESIDRHCHMSVK